MSLQYVQRGIDIPKLLPSVFRLKPSTPIYLPALDDDRLPTPGGRLIVDIADS